MAAALAAQADVGAQPDHLPLIRAAGVRFPQPDDVAEVELDYSAPAGVVVAIVARIVRISVTIRSASARAASCQSAAALA